MSKTAGILVIGNEILSGKTADENSLFLVRELRELGVDVRKISVIADDVESINVVARDEVAIGSTSDESSKDELMSRLAGSSGSPVCRLHTTAASQRLRPAW